MVNSKFIFTREEASCVLCIVTLVSLVIQESSLNWLELLNTTWQPSWWLSSTQGQFIVALIKFLIVAQGCHLNRRYALAIHCDELSHPSVYACTMENGISKIHNPNLPVVQNNWNKLNGKTALAKTEWVNKLDITILVMKTCVSFQHEKNQTVESLYHWIKKFFKTTMPLHC